MPKKKTTQNAPKMTKEQARKAGLKALGVKDTKDIKGNQFIINK